MNPTRGQSTPDGHEILRRRDRLIRERCLIGGRVILDFGCGSGTQTMYFIDAFRLYGVDTDRVDVEIFRKRNTHESVFPITYDGLTIPLRDESIEVVLSFEVLEHTLSESTALREIHRVLRPGGTFALTVPNKAWIFETHGSDLPFLRWNRVPLFSWLPKSIHDRYSRARIYRRREIIQLLEEHNFKVKSAEYITAPLDMVNVGWLKKIMRLLIFRGDTTRIPFLSTSIILICNKAGYAKA